MCLILGEFDSYGMPPQHTGLELSPVPCILRHPDGQCAGRRFSGWLYNTDVTATVLDILGAEPKEGMDGESVWPAVCDSAEAFREHLVCAYGPHISAWEEEWLYLVNADTQSQALYNLEDDPSRSTDVSGRYPSVLRSLARRMAEAGGPG